MPIIIDRMNLFERLSILTVVVTSVIITSCNSSDSSLDSGDKQMDVQSESESDSSAIEPLVDSVFCLKESFIENLETGWRSGYKDHRLAKKGFSYESIRNIKNGKERIFKNHQFKTELRISNVESPDGETFFSVNYQVTPEQLKCFEENLKTSSGFQFEKGSYTKKGLGTYAEKRFAINSRTLWISYTHRIGKELSLPPLDDNFHSIKRLDTINTN